MHKRLLHHSALWAAWWLIQTLPYLIDQKLSDIPWGLNVYSYIVLTSMFYATCWFCRLAPAKFVFCITAMILLEMAAFWHHSALYMGYAAMNEHWPNWWYYGSKRLLVVLVYLAGGYIYVTYKKQMLLKQRLYAAELELREQSLELYRQLLDKEQTKNLMMQRRADKLQADYKKEIDDIENDINNIEPPYYT